MLMTALDLLVTAYQGILLAFLLYAHARHVHCLRQVQLQPWNF